MLRLIHRTVNQRVYRKRDLVERYFNKIKHFRWIANRFDKLARNFLAAVALASTRLWLRAYESTIEPSVLGPLLNDYLVGMTDVVFAHGGTVAKIIGDALHVKFGAPGEQPDHAAHAVACAFDLNDYAEQFRLRWRVSTWASPASGSMPDLPSSVISEEIG